MKKNADGSFCWTEQDHLKFMQWKAHKVGIKLVIKKDKIGKTYTFYNQGKDRKHGAFLMCFADNATAADCYLDGWTSAKLGQTFSLNCWARAMGKL